MPVIELDTLIDELEERVSETAQPAPDAETVLSLLCLTLIGC
jgi:hypothetical protein